MFLCTEINAVTKFITSLAQGQSINQSKHISIAPCVASESEVAGQIIALNAKIVTGLDVMAPATDIDIIRGPVAPATSIDTRV